jgi:hypothetical protein
MGDKRHQQHRERGDVFRVIEFSDTLLGARHQAGRDGWSLQVLEAGSACQNLPRNAMSRFRCEFGTIKDQAGGLSSFLNPMAQANALPQSVLKLLG